MIISKSMNHRISQPKQNMSKGAGHARRTIMPHSWSRHGPIMGHPVKKQDIHDTL